MRYGLDFLGIGKYGKIATDEFPDNFALGAFTNVSGFGDALPAIEGVLKTGRCPEVRLHLHWEDDHKKKSDTFKKIEKEAKRVGAFFSKFPNIERKCSGWCEHTLSAQDAVQLRNIVMNHMPSGVQYVNSPWIKGGGKTIDGINEIHGNKEKPLSGAYNYSYDGQSSVDANVETDKNKYKDCDTFYLWIPQFNGRLTTEDKTPRDKRKAWPNSKQIDSVIYLSTPSQVDGKMPKGYIFKTHADQHTTPAEPRASKPVLIAPVKASKAELICSNGQVVGTLNYFGSFTGGGYRYYLGEYGYIIAEKARRITGSPVCTLRINGKSICKVNAAFRSGSFR